MKTYPTLAMLFVSLLAACTSAPGLPMPSPSSNALPPTQPPGPLATGWSNSGTAVVTYPGPAQGTPLSAPTAGPAAILPTLASGASPGDLKYQLLNQFPNLFFCDPDFYPVARANEADLARERFPQLQADTTEFQAILNHTGLGGLTSFTDDQKLLIYREHKKLAAVEFELAGDRYQFQLQTANNSKQGEMIVGLIDGRGVITVLQRTASIATCPICLAAHTLIDTPQGAVAVEDLRAGEAVWTADATGTRRSATILETVRVLVPADYQIVHVVLNDGRELWASAGHPLPDGRTLSDLNPGDRVDGASVARVERTAYYQPATFDLLPSGSTGFYWANGILLGSTLTRR
jgi:hypothetical protein